MRNALLAVLLIAFSAGATGLQINWVEYNPSTGRLVAQLLNDSEEPVGDFIVHFYADNSPIGVFGQDGLVLEPGSTISTFVNYGFDGKPHEFSAKVEFFPEEPGESPVPVEKNFRFGGAPQTDIPSASNQAIVLPAIIAGALVVFFVAAALFVKKELLAK